MLDEMISLLLLYPQVYVDVAGIDWMLPRKEFHRYLRTLVEAGFGKRIMSGSDTSMWPQTMAIGIQAIESVDFLTETQKRDILYNNAARFLRLRGKEQLQSRARLADMRTALKACAPSEFQRCGAREYLIGFVLANWRIDSSGSTRPATQPQSRVSLCLEAWR